MEAEERPTKLRKLSHEFNNPYRTNAQPASQTQQNDSTYNHIQTAQEDQKANGGVDIQQETIQPSSNIETIRKTSNASHEPYPQRQLTSSTSNPPPPQTTDPPPSYPEPLSKNQLKKARRALEWESQRTARKAKRREKTQAKKARRRSAKEAGTLQPKPFIRPKKVPIAIILDCSFDDLMTEKEIISLGSQVTRCYSENSRARFQVHLFVCGWVVGKSKLRERFEGLLKGMYRSWRWIEFVEGGVLKACERAGVVMRGKAGGRLVGALEGFGEWPEQTAQEQTTEEAKYPAVGGSGDKMNAEHDMGAQASNTSKVQPSATSTSNGVEAAVTNGGHPAPSSNPHTKLYVQPTNLTHLQDTASTIYLTADTTSTLTSLTPYSIYIIGGLIDKNRHKHHCYKLATETLAPQFTARSKEVEPEKAMILETARLPIGEYLRMSTRQVLATNHVVEIILRWMEEGDWGDAFLRVMPKRKGGVLLRDAQENRDVDGQGKRKDAGERRGTERAGENGFDLGSSEEDEEDEDEDEDGDLGLHVQLANEDGHGNEGEVEPESDGED